MIKGSHLSQFTATLPEVLQMHANGPMDHGNIAPRVHPKYKVTSFANIAPVCVYIYI